MQTYKVKNALKSNPENNQQDQNKKNKFFSIK